ncbi:Major Facilitator Superfamily protein [Halobacillus dabanensis]|uniref:Major Facilitator Superfamily protein n=1 Tax=Halobacillus dabanensis TaxID=240302 RepID=A0A1I3V294_HALDA|nr:Major Facilitator Superfamily protein [Halobacillus dabanensis]
MIYNVVLPGYVNETLYAASVVFGFSDMSYGVGGLLSGLLAAPFSKKVSENKAVVVIFLLAFATLIGLAANRLVLFIYLGSFIIGLSNSSIKIIMNTMLMEIVPKRLMGRTLSVWMGIALLCQALLASGLGLLIDMFSPSVGFVSMGGLMILGLAIQGFVWRKSHKRKSKIGYEVV